jgi:16S rRNA (guanine527-N7)-methyltransferase
LEIFAAELQRWQKIKNLVGPSAIPELWPRHIADALQLNDLGLADGCWLDIGSGGGLPAIPIAILRAEQRSGPVHMVESNGRKCAFLRHVSRLCGLDTVIHEGRIETVLPKLDVPVSVISARAVASLSQLIEWSNVLLRKGALGIFPKGQDVEFELREASTSWVFAADLRDSLTDPGGRIVLVRMNPT